MLSPGAATTSKTQSRHRTKERADSLRKPQPLFNPHPLLVTFSFIFFLVTCLVFPTVVFTQVSAPDFTIVVFPDPQNETQFFPQVLNSQLQWIVNNRQAMNIQMVLTVGDNVNDGAS